MRFYPILVLSTSALALALGIASPALAQDATLPVCAEGQTENCSPVEAPVADPVAEQTEVEGDAIVVTGTRINRPTLSSPTPLTSVSVNELTDTGDVSLGDALNDLPSLRSTFSQGNSTRFIGTAGLNLLDLRGLGTSRTLVLVNGRRHVTASPGDYLVDTNTIPVDLLQRVDGYRRQFGCLRIGRGCGRGQLHPEARLRGHLAQGSGGTSSRGDRGSYFIAGTWGTTFPMTAAMSRFRPSMPSRSRFISSSAICSRAPTRAAASFRRSKTPAASRLERTAFSTPNSSAA